VVREFYTTIERLLKTAPGRLFVKMIDDDAFSWAVVIAWNFLLSLFPIALVMAGVLGVGLGYIGLGSQQVYSDVASIIPDAGAQQQVLATLSTFHEQSGTFFVIGIAGLVWSGTGLFRSMDQSFAVVYRTPRRAPHKSLLMGVAMVLLLTVFGGLMIAATALLGLVSRVPYLPAVLANWGVALVLQVGAGVGIGFLLFLAIYWVVPNRRHSWRSVWIGAALSAVLFEAVSLAFPLYLRITSQSSAYGKTFGLLFLLMVYSYLLGLVTMVGVELNSFRTKGLSAEPGIDQARARPV